MIRRILPGAAILGFCFASAAPAAAASLDFAGAAYSSDTRGASLPKPVAAPAAAVAQVGGKGGSASEAQLVRRLVGLATECERRAIYLRSR